MSDLRERKKEKKEEEGKDSSAAVSSSGSAAGDAITDAPVLEAEKAIKPIFGKTRRMVSLEVYRAQAFTVSTCHFVEYWSFSPTNSRFLDLYVFFDFVASLFGGILCVGMGLNLFFWVRSRSRTHPPLSLVLSSLRKAAAFFVISVLFNLAVWGSGHGGNALDQDILMFYAFSSLAMPLLWNLGPRKMAAAAVLLLLATKGLYALSPRFLVPPRMDDPRAEFSCLRSKCAQPYKACTANTGSQGSQADAFGCKDALKCVFKCSVKAADAAEELEGGSADEVDAVLASSIGCGAPCVAKIAPGSRAAELWGGVAECGLDKMCLPPYRYTAPESAVVRRVRNWIHQGHFALLPWICFTLAGYVIAAVLYAEDLTEAVSRRRQRILGWIAAALVSTASAGATALCHTQEQWRGSTWVQCYDNVLSSTFEADEGQLSELFEQAPNPTVLYFVWALGWSFTLLWLFEPLNRPSVVGPKLMVVIKYFSLLNRYLLSMYCLQHYFIIKMSTLYSTWYAPDNYPWYYYENPSMNPYLAFVLGIVYYHIVIVIFWAWEKYLRSVGTLEWIVRLCTGM